MTQQWSVHWATLDPTEGSEQAGRRPVLIVSRESINRALPIVAVVPMTSRRRSGKVYATEVLLPAGTAGLPGESLALGHQIRTLSDVRLGDRLGSLDAPELRRRVQAAVRLFLDLD